jgi:hypothetical protein
VHNRSELSTDVADGDAMSRSASCVRWFGDLRNTDVPLVGGRNASLGEMYSALSTECTPRCPPMV